ncbi:MAG: DNA-formamidopyrimidine glycosylase family protein [Acidimicrobiales bacterium]|jgi:formamidopyrimidine-DNA glycosylase
MPELPEMQALAERLDAAFAGASVEGFEPLGFSALKTVVPAPDDLVGSRVTGVGRRGKYAVISLEGGPRILVHLSQAGRLDIESPARRTRPRGAVVRMRFDNGSAILVREYGSQRKAAWWLLAAGDDGPLATLGPEPDDPAFAEFLMTGDSTRRIHTLLRDQRTVAGIGRGYADDVLNLVGLSPFASLRSLTADQRARLAGAVHSVLDDALTQERARTGGLSEPKLGLRFAVHNRVGQPCPRCAEPLLRVSFESHEIAYCKHCQTKDRVLADRRLSRLLR